MTDDQEYNKIILEMQHRVQNKLDNVEFELRKLNAFKVIGFIESAIGVTIIATLPYARIGDLCMIFDPQMGLEVYAEVASIDQLQVKLLPFGSIESISKNCLVKKISDGFTINVADNLLGKIVNGFGKVIGNLIADDEDVVINGKNNSVFSYAPDPLSRPLIDQVFSTGIKAIDAFITCGRGQRIGIFAGPGMGKTTLMGMITRNCSADIVIVVLIGERGREIREFIEIELNETILQKCILVVATSDRPPVEQLKSAYVAQTIAEHFREQGKNVLMLFDSITRFARAGREVGLSAGEPITRGGFPPSVFLSFPKLMERAGNSQAGSITAFYTVLMEKESINEDPIADEVKSIIDGHIVLSKKLAEQGHFPAINILSSLSRIADRIITPEHLNAARHMRLLLSKFEDLEFLIKIGEYQEGHDSLSDEAVKKNKLIMNFLKQAPSKSYPYKDSIKELESLLR